MSAFFIINSASQPERSYCSLHFNKPVFKKHGCLYNRYSCFYLLFLMTLLLTFVANLLNLAYRHLLVKIIDVCLCIYVCIYKYTNKQINKLFIEGNTIPSSPQTLPLFIALFWTASHFIIQEDRWVLTVSFVISSDRTIEQITTIA